MSSLRGGKRKEFPVDVKKAAFARCCRNGTSPGVPQCEHCGIELNRRTGTIFEHLDADGLGGQPVLENCGCYCKTCADIKTLTHDAPTMVKADRVARKEYGLHKPKGPPMPGSKRSGLKKRMDGTVERRS
ncbi:MAG: hypothetical protein NVS3B5_01580 [Sphingomicrobium sp.]